MASLEQLILPHLRVLLKRMHIGDKPYCRGISIAQWKSVVGHMV